MNAVIIYKHEQDISIEIDGPTLADLFWDMDAEEQALFFNKLGKCERLPIQLQAVAENEDLELIGRRAMKVIGEYS